MEATTAEPPKVELRNVTKWHADGPPVLRHVSFAVERGESVAIVARVGGGKTTILKLIAGLDVPDEGDVLVDGRSVASLRNHELQEHRTRIGYVFEDRAHLTNAPIFENVALPLRYHRPGPEVELRARVEDLLSELGIKNAARLMPAQCHASVWKRALLARALALEPDLFLLDEPVASLVASEWEIVRRAVERRRGEGGATAILADHDGVFQGLIPERVVLLHHGQVAGNGTPSEMLALADRLEVDELSTAETWTKHAARPRPELEASPGPAPEEIPDTRVRRREELPPPEPLPDTRRTPEEEPSSDAAPETRRAPVPEPPPDAVPETRRSPRQEPPSEPAQEPKHGARRGRPEKQKPEPRQEPKEA